jgi:hypothetical protein
LTPANIQRIGQGKRNLQLRQTDLVGNVTENSLEVTVNTRDATSQRDRLTGINKKRDQFTFSRREHSLLAKYDTITNFEQLDRISIKGTRYRATLQETSGNRIRKLNAKQINKALGGRQFNPNEAAAFQVRGFKGTFIALNDRRSGFQAKSDSLIFLQDFNIDRGNQVTII